MTDLLSTLCELLALLVQLASIPARIARVGISVLV